MRHILVAILALTAGAIAGVVLMWNLSAEPSAAEPESAVTGAAGVNAEQVALNVQRDGRALKVHWDRNAPAIRQATHAVLHISDGKHQSNLNLDSQTLVSGSASYFPESREVGFRLEVFAPGRVVSGSIQAPGVAGEPSPVAGRAPKVGTRQAPGEIAASTADRVADAAPEPKPSPFAVTGRTQKRPAKAMALSAPAPEPLPRGVEEPAKPSKVSRVFGKIPLLRRLKKSPQPEDDKALKN